MGLGNEGYGFGPGERGAFAVGEEGRLAPGVEGVEALLGFSGSTRVDGMHVQAISTAVDLRGAHFDEMDELGLEAAFGDVFFQGKHGVERALGEFSVVDTWLHGFSFRCAGLFLA
jgi:hypothetical protein